VRQFGGPAGDVQIRDVALVMMLQLTKQRPADYGYPGAQFQAAQAMNPAAFTPQPQTDAQRERAAAKWKAWKAGRQGQAAEGKAQNPDR
jgi:hypothetical protein